MDKEQSIKSMKEAIFSGDVEAAKKAAEEFLKADGDPLKAIEEHLSPAMKSVGDKFEKLEIYLPELMVSADAMKAATDILVADIARKGLAKAKRVGSVVIGTVAGDVHDIGKNILSLMLQVSGFEVHDLGREVDSMAFIQKAEKVKADIIAASALMTTSMPMQREIINFLEDMGLRDKYIVMVGGAPTSKSWAETIGADGWAETAVEAAAKARELIASKGK